MIEYSSEIPLIADAKGLLLELAQQLTRVLAMRTGREDEFEDNDLAAIRAQKLLRSVRQLDRQLRRFPRNFCRKGGSSRETKSRKKRKKRKGHDPAPPYRKGT